MAVTTGLLDILDKTELEGVIAMSSHVEIEICCFQQWL